METYIPQLVNAVETRRSYRNFQAKELDEKDFKQILTFIGNLKTPFEHEVELTFHVVPEGKSIVYFKEPKNFATLLTSSSVLEQAKLGFLGELLILFCESINLRTCWVGHFNKVSVNQIIQNQSVNKGLKKIYCIIPIGYKSNGTSLIDSLSKKIFSRKSKDVDSFLHDDSIKDIPQSIRNILELACKAPSAMNSQKWYYEIKEFKNQFQIIVSKPSNYHHFKWAYYDIDVGTAAAHIWIGLLKENYDVKLKVENINENVRWTFEIPH